MVSRLDLLHRLSRIAPVGPDQPKAAKASAQTLQRQPGSIPILNIPRVHDHEEN